MSDKEQKDHLQFNQLYKEINNKISNTIFEDKSEDIFTNRSVSFVEQGKMDGFHPQENQTDSNSNFDPNSNFNSDSNPSSNSNQMVSQNHVTLNKVLVDENQSSGSDYKYSDGLDESIDDRSRIVRILTNKKFMFCTMLLIFIFTSIMLVKTVHLRQKVDEYEDFFVKIEKKESTLANVSSGHGVDTELLKNSAASKFIGCINSKVDIDDLPDSVNSIIKEMNDYYNQSNNYFAFAYKDIYTGFMVSYNENQQIFTASTIKAPTDIYIYEMASLGKANLEDKLKYTGGYYNTGSGVLKNKAFNTDYRVRTLLNYSTVYSDNAAHNMLMDKYGRENMLHFWQKLGTRSIFTVANNWGVTSAHDAVIYMDELYKFYLKNDTYGEELMNNFLNANPKFVKGGNGYRVANKSGWSGTAIHDVAIVFADNPYILVALSNLGDTDYYMSYFNRASDFAMRLHNEYWKYKMDMCSEINQY